jgi:hypothetical protein
MNQKSVNILLLTVFVVIVCSSQAKAQTNCLFYQIRPGDTFFGIASNYTSLGVTVQSLISANPAVNFLNLQIGSYVCVPLSILSSSSTTSASLIAYPNNFPFSTCSRTYTLTATDTNCNILVNNLHVRFDILVYCNRWINAFCSNLATGLVINY